MFLKIKFFKTKVIITYQLTTYEFSNSVAMITIETLSQTQHRFFGLYKS